MKKKFFEQPTAAQIKKYTLVREISEDLIDNILGLREDGAVIIRRDLVPEKFDGPKKFMKHGREVKVRRFKSLEEAANLKLTPVQLRELAFDALKPVPFSSYSFKPFIRTDKRTRKVSLVECLEGTKIYCYANHPDYPTSIKVKPYDAARRVRKDGAEIVVSVPSRTKKVSRYGFKFGSVPVTNSRDKWGLAHSVVTDHDCKSKRFNIRYRPHQGKESSRLFNWCAHEIAGYFAIVDYYWNTCKNLVPLEMNQFAIPTQEAVDFYSKLCQNCLIQTSPEETPRKLNFGEKEILLWGLVYKLKHDQTFFARGKVRDYQWQKP